MKKPLRLAAFALLILVLAIPVAVGWLARYVERPLLLSGSEVVLIPHGSTLSGVMADLEKRGMLGDSDEARMSRLTVRLYAMISDVDERLHVGEYRVEAGETLMDFLHQVAAGKVIQHSLTIVEGWNFREVRAALEKAPSLKVLTHDMSDNEIMKRLGAPGRKPEGRFAPNTYFYVRGETDLDVLGRAMQRQDRILNREWNSRATGLPYEKPYDALIMASIVEKETAVPSEREKIAGVFVRRLEKGMRLQTDPAVIYGLGKDYDGNLTRAELENPDNPYNTYMHSGLPPTPIAMPGEPSIHAALHPEPGDALYFVARGDGTHYFSSTLKQHEKAVRRFQLHRKGDYRSTPEEPGQKQTQDGKQGAATQ